MSIRLRSRRRPQGGCGVLLHDAGPRPSVPGGTSAVAPGTGARDRAGSPGRRSLSRSAAAACRAATSDGPGWRSRRARRSCAAAAAGCGGRLDHQIRQPGVAVDAVGALVERTRLQRRQPRSRSPAGSPPHPAGALARQQRVGGQQAGLERLADALAGEVVGRARRLAGGDQAGAALVPGALERCSAAARPSGRPAARRRPSAGAPGRRPG